ncbi:MAG: hypothetical protein ACI4NW_01280 [Stenotrophomonas sp.]
MEHHIYLVYAHLLLFAYWLAPDWGVYVTSSYVARADLPLAERQRFLQAALRIDLVPRSCLILLLPLGLQLASNMQLIALPAAAMPWIWAAGIAWLLLSWAVYRHQADALGQRLKRIDHGIRIALASVLIGCGSWALLSGQGVYVAWLAAKLIGFGVLLLLGLVLRRIMGGWADGFARLQREGSTPATEALFRNSLARARPIVWVFWLTSAAMAFTGLVKPF